MFKKIIYSCMALSLTLMPATEVLATEIKTDEPLKADTVVNSGPTGVTWTTGKVVNNGYTLTIQSYTPSTDAMPNYEQTAGALVLMKLNESDPEGSTFTLKGIDSDYAKITGGSVRVGDDIAGVISTGNKLVIGPGASIASAVKTEIFKDNTIEITSASATTPALILSNYQPKTSGERDLWEGTITITGTNNSYLSLQGYSNVEPDTGTNSVYQQSGGAAILDVSSAIDGSGAVLGYSDLWINNEDSYITAGTVNIDPGNRLVINANTNNTTAGATVGELANINIDEGATFAVVGNGTAVLNDTDPPGFYDTWEGNVVLGLGYDESGTAVDNPTLTLKNVSSEDTTYGTLFQQSGTLNIESQADRPAVGSTPEKKGGGSHIVGVNAIKDKSGSLIYNFNGTVNIKGDDTYKSSLTINYGTDELPTDNVFRTINLKGNADYIANVGSNQIGTLNTPTGTGANNTFTKTGDGIYAVGGYDLKMGYNVNVENGLMGVAANTLKIGIDDESGVTPYGDLTIGKAGNTNQTVFSTTATTNTIVGNMSLYNGLYQTDKPSTTTVGGNLYAGSGFNFMNGGIDTMNVAGTTTYDNMELRIDVDPQRGLVDTINSSAVVANANSTLNLVDYNLLSTPTRERYTFRVLNADGENYTINDGASKVVTGNAGRIISTSVGDYKMTPSAVKGAFDMALFQFNPQIFRGQVAADVIYANQTVINNQLFDRMFYSVLPYFNGRCTNKTASADTLFSPYQYTTQEPGLWFKPYANFETIHMTHGLTKVRNNAYGAMIGADFGRKDFGSWSFIPSAFIGYNGGRTTFNGVGMWHNGGQAGLMGTLTNKDFITSLALYAGGYHNSMEVRGFKDENALWNAGAASKTAYNLHLPWDFILQPTLYMAYNYVGASSFTSDVDGFKYKIDPLNAFSVAPGLNLIWQKETFSIYALFQAMFNVGATVSGQVAEFNLPHVGIRDPYFEYGLGASKFFLDRFSGYGQVVARSGSRKGVGFQLGLNVRL